MTTFAILKARIADEIARTDLTANIITSVVSAVAFYERRRFYFNEATTTFSTVSGQDYYSSSDNAAIATLIEIDSLLVTESGTKSPVIATDFQFIADQNNSSSATGAPQFYCYYKRNIRLSPFPDAVYTMTMAYVARLTALSADADTNAWTTDAEELIRCRAKWDLFSHVIRDFGEADRAKQAELEALSVLEAETGKRISPGRLRPTQF